MPCVCMRARVSAYVHVGHVCLHVCTCVECEHMCAYKACVAFVDMYVHMYHVRTHACVHCAFVCATQLGNEIS